MAEIDGVDRHSMFFPIHQDGNQTANIHGSLIDDSIPGSTANDSEFQMLLQSLLDKMNPSGNAPADSHLPNDASNPLSPSAGIDHTTVLLSLLGQMSQTASSTPDPNQAAIQQLSRMMAGFNQDQVPNSTVPSSDQPQSWVISKYAQAMRDFRNAFNLPVDMESSGRIQKLDMTVRGEPGINPAKEQVTAYITEQCKVIGLPVELGLATANTESQMNQFNKDGSPYRNSNPDSTDWGIMQINDKAWGDTYDFERIKSDWRYNVRAGLQILKTSYDAAIKNGEENKGYGDAAQNLARAAYSGYNAGTGNIWRYRTPIDSAPQTKLYNVVSNEGYDLRDIHFWDNYQKLAHE